jgi:hypothetical protein
LTGTVGDNVGVTNVATLTWRLRGTIAGVTQYWNAATQAWGTAVVNNATTPARPSTTSTWSSAGALPSGTTNLPDGTYLAYAIATDKAGNAKTVTNTLYIDRIAPTAGVSTPANGSTLSVLPAAISGSVNDNRGAATLANVTWSLRRIIGGVTTYWSPATQTWVTAVTNTVTTPARPGGGTTWSSTGTLPAGGNLVSGSYIAAVTATDAAGNVFTAQRSFTVDATVPTLSIIAPAAGAVVSATTVSGTAADANSGVGEVYIELGRTDDVGNLTHLYDWATHTWTTDDTLSSIIGLATGTTSWNNALPPLPVGNFVVYAISLDKATPPNESGWVSRVFNTTSVSNNSFTKPYILNGASGVISGGNTGANKETGEAAHAGNAGGKSIWYSWTPATSGTATFTTAGSLFDTVMGVYTGTTVAATTVVGANDDELTGTILTSKVVIPVVAGTNYRIAIDGYSGVAGDVVLTWSLAAGQGAAPAPVALSPVRLSSAAANASGTIHLTFTGPLQMASAANPSHYAVHVGGVVCEVESAQLDAGATGVTLALAKGSLTAGQTACVSWKLLDSQGRLSAGESQQIQVR